MGILAFVCFFDLSVSCLRLSLCYYGSYAAFALMRPVSLMLVSSSIIMAIGRDLYPVLSLSVGTHDTPPCESPLKDSHETCLEGSSHPPPPRHPFGPTPFWSRLPDTFFVSPAVGKASEA